MFKRILIPVLCGALMVLLNSGPDTARADGDPDSRDAWLTDGTVMSSTWEGLPDNLDRSARFLVLDGFANNGLGVTGDGQTTTLMFTYPRTPSDGQLRIALFDPNTIGFWDQRVDMLLVDRAPDVVYEVFGFRTDTGGGVFVNTEDLLLDANFANDPTPFMVKSAYKDFNKPADPLDPASPPATSAGNVRIDDIWCEMLDLTPADAETMAAAVMQDVLMDDGRHRVIFRARLRPAPVAGMEAADPLTVQRDTISFTGRERAGYKVAFNGTYLVPVGGTLGFAGGVIDERVRCAGTPQVGCADTEDPPFTPTDVEDGYYYDGVFNFHIHSTQACPGDIDFMDADADWNAAVQLGPDEFLTGAQLTGIPPENVPRYIRPNDLLCDGKRDIGGTSGCGSGSNRLIGDAINWAIFPVTNFTLHNSSLTPVNSPFDSFNNATDGHPSITAAQEPGIFKSNPLDQATLLGTPGLWCLRWQGVDAANFVFMQFDRPVGTTPLPELTVRVFCDADEDCIFDAGELPIPVNGGVANLRLTEVDCATQQPVPNGVDMPFSTDANGLYKAIIRPACYLIDFDGPPPLNVVGACTLPVFVNASLVPDTDTVDCPKVEIGLECQGMICGDVYCKNSTGDCVYDGGLVDEPLPNGTMVTITATPIINGVPDMMLAKSVTVTAPATRYCINDLDFGDYQVTFTFPAGQTPFPLASPPCVAVKQVTLSGNVPMIDDCDFGFECTGEFCGNVYCEGSMPPDCLYDGGVDDAPLPAGVSVEVTATLRTAVGAPPFSKTVTISGPGPNTAYCLTELPFGTYDVTFAFAAGSDMVPLSPACLATKEVVVSSVKSEVPCNFGFICTTSICGDVYCEPGGNCLYEPNLGELPLPDGTQVMITLTPIVGGVPVPADSQTVTVTAPMTRYCFNDLPFGDYEILYAFVPGSTPLPLAPDCKPVKTVTVDATTGMIDDCDFGFDCDTKICGRVYCDFNLNQRFDDPPDTPAVGWTVDALQGGVVVATTTTGADGTYCLEPLQAGTYTVRVTVPAAFSVSWAPLDGLTRMVTVPPDAENVDFRFDCRLCEIHGVIFCDDNLNGQLDPGDTRLDGYTVNATGPTGALVPTVSGPNGEYWFKDLPPGLYTISIVPAEFIADGITPPMPPSIGPLSCMRGDIRMDVNFAAKCLGRIFGYVFEDLPRQDCDGVYEVGIDRPVDGATIRLTGPAILPAPNPRTTVSDINGFYEFPDLPPGNYTVEILAPLPAKWAIRNLTLNVAATPRVQDVVLPLQGEERRDFGHCTQALSGKVFKQPFGFWDGEFDVTIDTPLPQVLVELLGTGGDALAQNFSASTRTDANGDYEFEDIPTGTYEITLSTTDGVTLAILSELIDDGATVLTPTVQIGDVIPDLDFPKCEPCVQELCICVFKEKAPKCDGEFDERRDEPAANVEIRVEDLNSGRVVHFFTDKWGEICIPNVPPGEYSVSILPDQPALRDCRLSPGSKLEQIVVFDPEICEDQKLWFGFCCCPRTFCCKGDLHEVLTESGHWVGHDPGPLNVYARIYRGCDYEDLLDEVELDVDGRFPGIATGNGEILAIEHVEVNNGIATVLVRVTAAGPRFPVGRFGSGKHLFEVYVNDNVISACTVFRAEVMRPGLFFPWSKKCGRPPQDCCNKCDWDRGEEPRCDPKYPMELDWNLPKCNTCELFGVIDVYCYKDWRACHPCECKPCGPCKGGLTELSLKFKGKKRAHVKVTSNHGTLFDGRVDPWEIFTFEGKGRDGRIGEAVWLFVNDCLDGDICTDCTHPVKVGDHVGWFVIAGARSLKGGELCTPEDKHADPGCPCKKKDKCKCKGGVSKFVMRFNGTHKKLIKVTSNHGELWNDWVDGGQTFTLNGRGPGGSMGSAIWFFVDGRYIDGIHTSCSKPVGPGMHVGDWFTVMDGWSRDGGHMCDGEPKCRDCGKKDCRGDCGKKRRKSGKSRRKSGKSDD